MKRYAGLFIGTFYILIAFGAFRNGLQGFSMDHTDLGVWWSVIGGLLSIAALGALLGTWIHAWAPSSDEHH